MSVAAPASPPAAPNTGGAWKCVQHSAIAEIAEAWDTFVPRDKPHLRAGMFAAVEAAGFLKDPAYFLLTSGEDLLAVAFVYTLPVDTVATAPAAVRNLVARVRRRAPGFLWKAMRVCGPPISNATNGIHFAPELSQEERRRAMAQLGREIVRDAGLDPTLYFREFTEEEVDDYAWELERLGFFQVDPWPGTAIEIRWKTFEDYLAALRKRYRKRIRGDFKASAELEIELLDSFADIAPRAFRLYADVLENAEYNLETLTEAFYLGMSDFDDAKLLVAREPKTGEVLGANLLLFGETHMQNLFIGIDYEHNEKYSTYFSLVEHSLRLAIERGCRVGYFGQDSYEFKARLGARPIPLRGYMKHRIWPVHWFLRASRNSIFPGCEPVTHDVFQDEESR